MDTDAVFAQLQEVFNDTFMESVTLTPTLQAGDVAEWDSFTHVSLIVAVEQHFKIRFGTGEVEQARNVEELVQLIQGHLT